MSEEGEMTVQRKVGSDGREDIFDLGQFELESESDVLGKMA